MNKKKNNFRKICKKNKEIKAKQKKEILKERKMGRKLKRKTGKIERM